MYLASELPIMSQFLDKIKYMVRKLFSRGRKLSGPESEGDGEVIESARMTNNRLQSLTGQGHRQCYMEKLREVAAETAPSEDQKEYWFKTTESSTNIAEMPPQSQQAKDNDKGLTGCLPNRAKITSYRLKAYIDTLPKEKSEHDEA